MSNRNEAGFTLIEALIAIVILVVGLAAIANLFLVASSSNAVANKNTAATAQATEVLERLKAIPFIDPGTGLPWANWPGGNLAAAPAACGVVCNEPPTPDCVVRGTFDLCRVVGGVGTVHTRWQIVQPVANTLFITVRSEVIGPFGGALSRAEFSTFRTCTTNGACP